MSMAIGVFVYCGDCAGDEYLARLPAWLARGELAPETFSDKPSLLEALAERGCDVLVLPSKSGQADLALAREAERVSGTVKILVVSCVEASNGERAFLLGSPVAGEDLAGELFRAASARPAADKLTFKSRGSVETIRLRDIIMLESGTRKICAYTEDREHCAYGSLAAVSKQLDGRFLQCHKSFIVNMDYIDLADRFSISLAQGRFSAPISQSRRKQAHKAISEYFAGENRVASKHSSNV